MRSANKNIKRPEMAADRDCDKLATEAARAGQRLELVGQGLPRLTGPGDSQRQRLPRQAHPLRRNNGARQRSEGGLNGSAINESDRKTNKPIDCFTDEKKRWALKKIKAELPDEWQRLVNRQAHNMEVYEPTDEARGHWALDALKQRKAIEALPFYFGDDGWEPSLAARE